MDSDNYSAQVERLEVVETGRRRRWSEDEKLKIVLESLQVPRQVAATARRYDVSRSLLLRWRRPFRPQPKDAPAQQLGFVPAMVAPESGPPPGSVRSSAGAIEIEFAALQMISALQKQRSERSWVTHATPLPVATFIRSIHYR